MNTLKTESTVLSEEELNLFFEQGFIGPFKLYEEEEAKDILHQVRMKNIDRSNILFDNDVNYDRHFDIQELSDHVCHPGIVNRVSAILGKDVLNWRTEFFPKFPGSKATEWHQVGDYSYATGEPMLIPTKEISRELPMDLTVWTAFTEATKENGCMKFMPGSHKTMYFDERKPADEARNSKYKSVESDTSFFGYNFADFKIDPNWVPDESKAVAMEMKPGECVIFSAKCMHASYPNITERSTRFAITARYVSNHVRVYPGKDGFVAHGGKFDLANYGCVQVKGEDTYNHNRIRRTNNLGVEFKKN